MNLRTDASASAAANLVKLPELCYALMENHDPGKRIVLIRAGEQGCHQTDFDLAFLSLEQVQCVVNRLNFRLGVDLPQVEAMTAGSMFGWHVPGADTAAYENLAHRRSA